MCFFASTTLVTKRERGQACREIAKSFSTVQSGSRSLGKRANEERSWSNVCLHFALPPTAHWTLDWTHLDDRESWKCISPSQSSSLKKVTLGKCVGSQIRVFRIFKAHIWVKYHSVCWKQVPTGGKLTTRNMSLLIRFTMYLQTNWSQSGTFESRSILAGTDLLRFTEFWLREKILNMSISQMAHESRSSANHHELGSNSNHGTDDLNLPVDSWVLEAPIE